MNTVTSCSSSDSTVIHHQWRSTMASDWTDAVVVTRTLLNGLSVFCRKHGDLSERAGDRRWFTVARSRGLKTSTALKTALTEAEEILDISLDWEWVVARLAALDWLAAAALAPLVGMNIPTLPKPSVLERQGIIQKKDTVKLSIEWGYEVHSLEMPMERWLRLCDGKVSSARSRGFYEGCSFWNYWTFRLGEEDSLTVTYGEDGGTSYEGPIEHATLHGPKPQGIHVAEVALTQALQRRRG